MSQSSLLAEELSQTLRHLLAVLDSEVVATVLDNHKSGLRNQIQQELAYRDGGYRVTIAKDEQCRDRESA